MVFHALRDDVHAELARDANAADGERAQVGVAAAAVDEAVVAFRLAERQAAPLSQRRVARAEVVDRQADSAQPRSRSRARVSSGALVRRLDPGIAVMDDGPAMPLLDGIEVMHISPKTVETHRAEWVRRLDTRDVAGLARFALREGLIADSGGAG